jgi:hypothetical protein
MQIGGAGQDSREAQCGYNSLKFDPINSGGRKMLMKITITYCAV